jgi:dipeptidyl aminopeptidase/acylaminoacyl peptidase
MSSQKIRQPYGLWESPITPLSLAHGNRLSDVTWAEDFSLLWLEGRSDRGVVAVQPPDGQAWRDLNDEFSIRARVGYGGGDFTVGHGYAYFVAADSGRIYRQSLAGGRAEPVTPAFGRAAAPKLSPDGRWLAFIHTYEGQDALEIVDSAGKLWPQKLAYGDDFYMQPAWHPDGKRIAWIAWNHPNMPWDGTRLSLCSLAFPRNSLPLLGEAKKIAGNEDTSIFQPEFSPDGRYLAYVSDQIGWWQIYLMDMETGEHRQLTSAEAEHGSPAWVQGQRTYAFDPRGNELVYIRNRAGFATLWRVSLASGQIEALPLEEAYTWLEQIAISPDGERIALLASGGRTPARLISYQRSAGVQVIRRTTAEDLPLETYSAPQAITWQGMDDGIVHGLFYPPQNGAFEGIGLPPLIVLVHGGPTSQRTTTFDGQVQFFTSRGYAALQVNYRGSTGYGRAYRDMLRGAWGIYDIQDAISGVRHLAGQGLVDQKRVVIMGGSAGGFTVLKALEDYPGFFKAGINLYGVTNHFTCVAETHKFEARYWDSLLGPLPEAAEIYRERSPIFFIEKIKDPLAVFQGEIDEVVPRNQSDELVAELKRRGVPHIYHVYPGEGHGFRKVETIQHLYQAIDNFLKQYVLYT